MRIITIIVLAVVLAALLVWGLGFGGWSPQTVEVTKEVTVEVTKQVTRVVEKPVVQTVVQTVVVEKEKVVEKPVEVTRVVTATPGPTDTPSPTPTPTLTPTATPTATPTVTATTVATQTVTAAAVGGVSDAEHWKRLEELDPLFRNQGWKAWLKEAGMTWTTIEADARQIEEETTPGGRIVAAGLQVKAKNLWVPWPNVVTTDVPSRITETSTTRKHQPDLRNASVLYTNVYTNGPVTIWVDGSNWGQLVP